MKFNQYDVGLRNAASYQVSGWPWVTGSTLVVGEERVVNFPMVTKSITVIQSGSGELRLHFAATASGGVVQGNHYISLNADKDSVSLNVKCKRLYMTCVGAAASYEVAAELTNINTDRMFILTGSGITE
tara:strand:- start:1406 stop:1792 length:387 start_codon:yes stop_codon:yes gene_type:complete